MKIVFFGSGNFAVPVLEALLKAGPDVCLVVTQPDRKKGRHLFLRATPVKDRALACGIGVFQPQDINQPDGVQELRKQEADFFVVVSYGRILSCEVLGLARLLCVNIHASVLPKYRGAAPIARALMAGERRTGVTFIKMNERMDQGDIIFKKSEKIEKTDNALTLEERLSKLAADSVPELLRKLESKNARFRKQDARQATYAPLLVKRDGLIDWQRPAQEVFDRFRGCFGWPGSFTYYKGRLLKVFAMEIGRPVPEGEPGQILQAQDDVLEVACDKGSVLIREVLPESHKRMPVRSFLAGHQVRAGESLGT